MTESNPQEPGIPVRAGDDNPGGTDKFAYHGAVREHGREDTVEFIDVVKRLWDSWDDGALVREIVKEILVAHD